MCALISRGRHWTGLRLAGAFRRANQSGYDTNYDTTPLSSESDLDVSYRKDWSGREDLNLRPPGPEAEKIKNLSASFGVA